MELLARGRYVITDAGSATPASSPTPRPISGARSPPSMARLRRKHRGRAPWADGTQLLMPGLVDAHSHGAR